MKKNKICIGLIITIMICLFISPISVYAKTYTVWGTDISLVIDDSEWYVFTRDNLYGHSGLEELNITEDRVYNFMQKNYIYLYGMLLDKKDMNSSLELLVSKTTTDELENLSTHSYKEVMEELVKPMAEERNAEIYDVYENDYKFTYLEFKKNGYNVIQYFTVMNGDCYTILLQKKSDFTNSDKIQIRKIIDSITFDVDKPVKEELSTTSNKKEPGFSEELIASAIKGGIIGGTVGIASLIITIIRKRKDS